MKKSNEQKSNNNGRILNIPRKFFFLGMYALGFIILMGSIYLGTWLANRPDINPVNIGGVQVEPTRINHRNMDNHIPFQFDFRLRNFRVTNTNNNPATNAQFEARAIRNDQTPSGGRINNIQYTVFLAADWIDFQTNTPALRNLNLHSSVVNPVYHNPRNEAGSGTDNSFDQITINNINQTFPAHRLGVRVSRPCAFVIITWLDGPQGGNPTRHTYVIRFSWDQFRFHPFSRYILN